MSTLSTSPPRKTVPPEKPSVEPSILDRVSEFIDEMAFREVLHLDQHEAVLFPPEDEELGEDEIPLRNAPTDPESAEVMERRCSRRILDLVRQRVDNLDSPEAAFWWLYEQGVISDVALDTHEAVHDHIPSESRNHRNNEPISVDLTSSLEFNQPELGFECTKRGISPATLKELHIGFLPSKKTRTVGLKNRIVFQIRGVEAMDTGLESVIYSHMGLATNQRQGQVNTWSRLKNFSPWLEIYNLDQMALNQEALAQAQEAGHFILVSGCFDVAKLWESGIKNVGATFGNSLNKHQIAYKLRLLAQETGIRKFLVFFDRSQYLDEGNHIKQDLAVDMLQKAGLEAVGFDWKRSFKQGTRMVQLPTSISSPAQFPEETLRWFRQHCIV